MKCSRSDLVAGFGSRLGFALAASAALHVLGVAALQQSAGTRWGGLDRAAYREPIRAVLAPAVAHAGVAPSLSQRAAATTPNAPTPTAAANPSLSADPGPDRRTLVPAHHYYLTRELDVRPGIMTRVEPGFPEAAARRFMSGRVVVRLYIGEDGEVEKADVVSAEPPGYFEDAAVRAFLASRFSPGMKNGRAVKVQMTLEVNFDSPEAPRIPGG